MDKKKLSTPQITKIALMVAFVSAASYLRIPLPFSEAAITGQTLAVNLGASGPGKMFGPAGGYFIGFIVAVVLIAWLRGKKYNIVRYALVAILIGIPIIDGAGFVWMKFAAGMTWKAAFFAGFVPFIPLDIVKCIAAVLIAKPIQVAFYAMEDSMGHGGKKKVEEV